MKKMKKMAGAKRQKLGNGFGRRSGIPRPVKKKSQPKRSPRSAY